MNKSTHISVRTREGVATFRRAGFQFQRAEPTVIALADITPEQLLAIRSEPELEVAESGAPEADRPSVPAPAPDDTPDTEPHKRGRR